ncbi:MAG: nitroreductase family protein [Acidimicrobiia bacterium]|nr:nitroreductase family protein [Acidimicrobiia bacterium]
MELQEAIGTRRSYRFLLPHKPVELEKIQKMLEAARLASFWGNVQALRAVVVRREHASEEVMDALFALVAGFQIRRAPVVIVWYLDYAALDVQGDRLEELVRARALGVDEDAALAFLDETLIPFFEAAMPHIKQTGLTDLDCGQGIAQATLVAVEQGLGTCLLGSAKAEDLKRVLSLPETAKVLVLQCVGYPAETREAGGQRPRLPFEELYSLDACGTPFPRDPDVVQDLRDSRMLQEPAPLPWRQEELDMLQRALDLPDF